MSQAKFIEFYEKYLPKHDDVREKLESSKDAIAFVKNAVALGKKHGFGFDDEDVVAVMAVADKTIALPGRKHPKTVRIRSITSVDAIKAGVVRDTSGCCW
jgi:hypothetical protein